MFLFAHQQQSDRVYTREKVVRAERVEIAETMDETKTTAGTSAGEAGDAKPEGGDNAPINIKIKDSQGEVHFRVKMNTKFTKVTNQQQLTFESVFLCEIRE